MIAAGGIGGGMDGTGRGRRDGRESPREGGTEIGKTTEATKPTGEGTVTKTVATPPTRFPKPRLRSR